MHVYMLHYHILDPEKLHMQLRTALAQICEQAVFHWTITPTFLCILKQQLMCHLPILHHLIFKVTLILLISTQKLFKR